MYNENTVTLTFKMRFVTLGIRCVSVTLSTGFMRHKNSSSRRREVLTFKLIVAPEI